MLSWNIKYSASGFHQYNWFIHVVYRRNRTQSSLIFEIIYIFIENEAILFFVSIYDVFLDLALILAQNICT